MTRSHHLHLELHPGLGFNGFMVYMSNTTCLVAPQTRRRTISLCHTELNIIRTRTIYTSRTGTTLPKFLVD